MSVSLSDLSAKRIFVDNKLVKKITVDDKEILGNKYKNVDVQFNKNYATGTVSSEYLINGFNFTIIRANSNLLFNMHTFNIYSDAGLVYKIIIEPNWLPNEQYTNIKINNEKVIKIDAVASTISCRIDGNRIYVDVEFSNFTTRSFSATVDNSLFTDTYYATIDMWLPITNSSTYVLGGVFNVYEQYRIK